LVGLRESTGGLVGRGLKMRRILVVLAAVVLWGAPSVSASSVPLKGGARAEPTFTDGGLFLEAAGELQAWATAMWWCR
jgi:hypothetical protein